MGRKLTENQLSSNPPVDVQLRKEKAAVGIFVKRMTKTWMEQGRCHVTSLVYLFYWSTNSLCRDFGYDCAEKVVTRMVQLAKDNCNDAKLHTLLENLLKRNELPVYKKIPNSVEFTDAYRFRYFLEEEMADAVAFFENEDFCVLGMDTETDSYKLRDEIDFDLVQLAFGESGKETVVFLKGWKTKALKEFFHPLVSKVKIVAWGSGEKQLIDDGGYLNIQRGNEALTTVYARMFGRHIDKGATMSPWSIPIGQYGDELVDYAAIDAIAVLRIYQNLK